jgi:FemAB-related protein (PEP-CTERM system-associated)
MQNIKFTLVDIKNIDKKTILFFEENPNSTYAHSINYIKSITKTYKLKTKILILTNKQDRILGVLPFSIITSPLNNKNKAVSLPYSNYGGWILETGIGPTVIEDAFVFLQENYRIDSIELRFKDINSSSSEYTFILKLPNNPNDLWKGFKDKVRNQIRKANKFDFEVKWGSKSLKDFYTLYKNSMSKYGTPPHSYIFFENIVNECSTKSTVLSLYFDGEPAGSMFIIKHLDTWVIPYAAINIKHRSKNINMIMYWLSMNKAIEEGYSFFDFGRSHVDSGTFRFKKQWGSTPVPIAHKVLKKGLSPSSDSVQNYRGKKGEILASIWKILPAVLQNVIGPRIRRYIP